jgi:hypothetical protein
MFYGLTSSELDCAEFISSKLELSPIRFRESTPIPKLTPTSNYNNVEFELRPKFQFL